MKRTWVTLIFLLVAKCLAYGQDCNCKTNLDSLISNVERNYSGYYHKVNKITLGRYSNLKDSLRKECIDLKGYDCYQLLKKYILFFNDPHLTLNISSTGNTNQDTISAIFSAFEKRPLDEQKLKDYYSKLPSGSIEGIWQANMVKYKVAVIKDTTGKYDYVGLIIDGDSLFWFPGQLKMGIKKDGANYKVHYLRSDHFPDDQVMRLENGEMLISGYGTWRKTFPVTQTVPKRKPPVYFSMLPGNIPLLSVANFSLGYKNLIDSLITSNGEAIRKSRYFLIDLRNNAGGVSMSFEQLLPLVYTVPIVRDGFLVRSSRDNIDMYQQSIDDPEYPDDIKEDFRKMVAKMQQHPDSLVLIYGADTSSYDSLPAGPPRVGIIVNEGTVSAAEAFVLLARQSHKVTIFGTHTKGALDYTEIGDPRPLPCPYLSYLCPMGTKEYKVNPRIDNIGIKPDIAIPETEHDWIRYILRYYASHK